jgi:hypothetical protein
MSASVSPNALISVGLTSIRTDGSAPPPTFTWPTP